MPLSFRVATFLVVACLVPVASAFAADEKGQLRKNGDGVYSFTMGQGNYSMIVVGDEAVAVFETFDSKHSKAMLAAIRGLTDKPVKYAFQSHNHWDHASGGRVFGEAAVEMPYMGLNHGLGLTMFTIPERRAVYIADLVTPNRVMFTVVPDFNIGEWERSLGEILELQFDLAVCSHNALPVQEALAGCTRKHVTEERQFIRDLRNAIIAEFQKGTGFLDVPKAVRLPQYAHWVGYEPWLEMNTLRLMTDLWMGPFPWVPDADHGNSQERQN